MNTGLFVMACGIIAINQSVGSCGSDGGIHTSQGASCDDIVEVTVDANGQITGFTMSGTGGWATVVYDDDDTALYNQTPERQGKKINFIQGSFFKFEQITNDKIQAANKAKSCCCSVWVHHTNSGIALVQGIDVADDGSWQFSKTNARVDPGVLTDTGANADRVEYTINSKGRCLSAATTLSEEAIALL